jgi:hypothetical protein
MAQRPLAVGLFLCEQVVVEKGTENITLVNCFTRRDVRRLPSEPLPFIVFAVLTDGSGSMPVKVTIQRLDNLDEIYAFTRVVPFRSPLEKVRCMLRIRNCSFPLAGEYQVTLYADNEPIAQQKLSVHRKGGTP